jgi:hypothetical protein
MTGIFLTGLLSTKNALAAQAGIRFAAPFLRMVFWISDFPPE